MIAPRIKVGNGTLGRFKRPRPIVTLGLQDNGYGPGTSFHGEPCGSWTCMSAAEARKLGERLLRAADKAEGRR